MGKKLDYSGISDYVEYLTNVRGSDESRIRYLCSPIIRLITERGYTTEQFLTESYERIYESLTGKPYRTKESKLVRQAINNYRSYAESKQEENTND